MASYHPVAKLLCVLALSAISITAAAQETAKTESGSCRRFAQEFYGWYVPLTQKRLDRPASTVAIGRKPALFAPALLQALKADAEAQEHANGDIVGLDFDPFVSSQDPADRYAVRKVAVQGDKCSVEVWANPSRGNYAKSAKPNVVAKLSKHEGKWQFDNFRYPDLDTDLVATLESLRKERLSSK